MKKTINKRNFPDFLLPGLITACLMLICFIILKCFIFGSNTLALGDAQSHYIPLMQELRDRIFGDGGLFYSWSNGLGSELYANIGNYLLSPVNILVILMKWFSVYEAFDLAVLLKAALSASAFAYFLKNSFNRFDTSAIAFSVMYSLCGFFTAYHTNVMWLDAMIFVPLIALGIERLVEGKSGILYCVSLSLSIITCFNMGFILCIFSVLYLLTRIFGSEGLIRAEEADEDNEDESIEESPENEHSSNGYMLPLLLKFGLYSVIAGALSAFALYPLLLALGDSIFNFAEQQSVLISFSDFLASHLIGVDTLSQSLGSSPLPNSFSGILTLLLAFLLLFTRDIKLGERITYSLLAIALALSFIFSAPNFVWHGFSVPEAYTHRFAFVYSFILILIAYKVFVNIKSVKPYIVPIGGIITAGAFVYLLITGYSSVNSTYIYVSIGACMLYTGLLLLIRLKPGIIKITELILLAAVISECLFSCLTAFAVSTNSDKAIAERKAVLELQAQTGDTSLHRSENLGKGLSLGIAGSLYGYNGISDYFSLNDTILNYSVGNMGIKCNFNNLLSYVEQTPVFNSFFAIKYLYCFGEEPQSTYALTKMAQKELPSDSTKTLSVYKNEYSLPVAFCVNKDYENWNASLLYNFTSQNALFSHSTGIETVLRSVSPESYSADSAKISKTTAILQSDLDEIGTNDLTDEQKKELSRDLYSMTFTDIRKASASFVYTAESDAPYYMYYSSEAFTTVNINIDGKNHTKDIDWKTTPGIIVIPPVKEGSKITVTAKLAEELASSDIEGLDEIDSAQIQIKLCELDRDKFTQGYEYLKSGQLNVSEYKDTYIKGTLTAKDNQIIYTSIPYTQGWSAYLDGEEAEIRHNDETGLIMLNADAGEHTLELKYEVPGLKTGLLVSAAALILLVCAAMVEKKIRKLNEER